jgi:hypothetical protein
MMPRWRRYNYVLIVARLEAQMCLLRDEEDLTEDNLKTGKKN